MFTGLLATLLGSPIVLLLIAVAAFLLFASSKKKGRPLLQGATLQPYRSHRDLEIEEDAELVRSHYVQTAKNAYTQAALARHREQLVDADQQESTFRAAISSWAAGNVAPATKK